ncbi:hypothetical protein VPNG_06270 [Cytospora leucostoma]|uniref:WSC domain-containing protein n=1 Tax=Cytospora leucostoma TaxID=1230097 RepID=A0A423X2M3_9PEZI|nr:hypothetical protein VPNG_06270 [Cytospora leucostoma]
MGRLQRLLASTTLLALGTSQRLTYQGCVALDTSGIATTADLYPAGPGPCLAYCSNLGYRYAGLTAQFCSCFTNAPRISRTYTNRNHADCGFNCDSPYQNEYCGGIDVTNLNFLYSYYANPAAAAAASSSTNAAAPAGSDAGGTIGGPSSTPVAGGNTPGPGPGPGNPTSGSISKSAAPARATRRTSTAGRQSVIAVPVPGSPGVSIFVPVQPTPGAHSPSNPNPVAPVYPPYGPPPPPGVNPGGPGGPGGPGLPGAGPGSIPGTESGAYPPYGPPPPPGVNPGGPGGPGGPGLPGAGPGSIPGTADGRYPPGYLPAGSTTDVPDEWSQSLLPGESFAMPVSRLLRNPGDQVLSYVPEVPWLRYNAGNNSFYGTVPVYQPPIIIVLNVTAGQRTVIAKRDIYMFEVQITILPATGQPTLTFGAPGGPGGGPTPGPEVTPGSNGSLSYTNTVYETCTRTYTRCPICEAETRVVAVPIGTTCIPAKYFTTPCVVTTNMRGDDGEYTWGVYTTDKIIPYNPAESTPVLSAWGDATTRVHHTVLVGITRTVEVVSPTVKDISLIMVPDQIANGTRLLKLRDREVKNRSLLPVLAKARVQSRFLSLLVFKVMGPRSLLRAKVPRDRALRAKALKVKVLRIKVKVRAPVRMRVLTVTALMVEETSPLKLQALAVKETSLPMLLGRTVDGMSLLQLPGQGRESMSLTMLLGQVAKGTSHLKLLHLKARRRMPVRQEVRRPKLALTLELLILELVPLELFLRRASLLGR